MARMEHPRKAEIEAIRTLIRGVDPRIGESVKWNAPSFYIDDHFATLKLRPMEAVQVILHTGAKVKAEIKPMEIPDPTGLLKWAAKDRCVITFTDMEQIKSQESAFTAILKRWIEQL